MEQDVSMKILKKRLLKRGKIISITTTKLQFKSLINKIYFSNKKILCKQHDIIILVYL